MERHHENDYRSHVIVHDPRHYTALPHHYPGERTPSFVGVSLKRTPSALAKARATNEGVRSPRQR